MKIKNHLLKISFSLAIALSLEAQALVDYSDKSEGSAGDFSVKSQAAAPQAEGAPRKRGMKYLEFSTSFDSMEFSQNGRSGKAQMVGGTLSLRSPYSFFAELSYFEGRMEETNREHKSSESGNPKLIIGSNWLQLGGPQDNARVDVYVGVSNKTKNSAMGSSRTDKIVGVETSKQILALVLGLSGQYILTGNPEDSSELRIGNIARMGGGLGLVLSPDIRFSMEANYYRLSRADNIAATDYALVDDVTFSTLGPKLILGMGQLFELELGAHFQTKRPQTKQSNVNLLDAKLFQFPGAYGNSLFAGINISV